MAVQLAEVQAAAQRKHERLSHSVQEVVDWDPNTRSGHSRTAHFDFSVSVPNGTTVCLDIVQSRRELNEPGEPQLGTGGVVWMAAVGLARYLEHHFTSGLEDWRVLELGCGTGLVSYVAAALGASVTCTDTPECLAKVTVPNIEANATRLQGSVAARELVWGQTALEPAFGQGVNWWELVVAADCVYRSEHAALLLHTLQGVLGPGRKALVALDRRGREGSNAFLQAAGSAESGFAMREVDNAVEMPSGYRFVHFLLVELTRISEMD
eukprot:CAMPEP_0181257806 /NCGR_PEP_ID=MMETSP1096-20121128/50445_1 /TAXON_ID=156174 ORGANISM="Chrysochromulina ericina, Strain CCMP281" /NCGR_SAMPLE_ID=MMETSP1096 /ASSEMBLY_ACC=CAM_ASM_000453 /LENGTH=266 /DNA_ID=CAMNT_0023356157 /DNA_START=47 /DNA_END=847 /DNA_ORIENTATION=+